MTRRVLITGGCGFVGRHFVRAFLDAGDHVTVVDDLSAGVLPDRWSSTLQPGNEPFSLHVLDVRSFIKDHTAGEYDLIVHLAAVVGGRLTIESKPLLVATDLAIDADLFNWVVSSPFRGRLLYFSSSAAYPIGLQTRRHAQRLREDMIDLDGDTIGMADMTYGWSKLTGELLARHAVRQHGLDVLCFRPFSGYGEDQDLTYPFPSIMRRVARGERPITVWGSGQQQRDFIHIDDVVCAVLRSIDVLDPGTVVNLGSGVGTSFAELAHLAAGILGTEAEVRFDTTKPEGVFSRVCDPSRLNTFFTPSVSLADGVTRALEVAPRHLFEEAR